MKKFAGEEDLALQQHFHRNPLNFSENSNCRKNLLFDAREFILGHMCIAFNLSTCSFHLWHSLGYSPYSKIIWAQFRPKHPHPPQGPLPFLKRETEFVKNRNITSIHTLIKYRSVALSKSLLIRQLETNCIENWIKQNNRPLLFCAGDGGNSGIQRVFVNTVKGNVELRTCRGTGAPAALNGQGGIGTSD